MAKKFKVTIDPRDECISDMACVSLCPDVFEMSEEDGKTQIVEKYRVDGKIEEGLVPEDLEECIRSAAEACPVQIIHVEEVNE
ncbi:MAG: ferredoxin [Thermoproteales archaeon]|nr:ferredoxin [Thermoproteales archaeon]